MWSVTTRGGWSATRCGPPPRAAIAGAVGSGRLPPDRPVTVGALTWVQDLGKSGMLQLMCVAEADPHNNPGPAPCDAREVGDVWDWWVRSMTGLEADVLRRRVAAVAGCSYPRIGARWDVTGEYARQTAAAVAAQLRPGGVAHPVGDAAELAAAELAAAGPISPNAPEALEAARALAGDVPWVGLVAARAYTRARPAKAGSLLRADVAPSVARVAGAVDGALLEGWCGLVDSQPLAELIDPAVAASHDTVFVLAGLVRVGDRWATAATNTARVASVLYDAETPLSTDRVVALSGVGQPRSVRGALTGALSDVVARAGFRLWWRADRVVEPYEGAPQALARTIGRSPDGAVPVDVAVERLASLGVSRRSARAVIRADRFRTGPDGLVRLVPVEDIAAARADDGPADGHRPDGTPFWTVTVLAAHLRGYSLRSVPYGLGLAAGVTPGETVRLDVTEPAGCGPVTVSWPLGYETGCVVGHLRVPFGRLGLKAGDMCDIAVSDGTVRFLRRAGDRPPPKPKPKPRSKPKPKPRSKPKPRVLQPCGTVAAYHRHLRRGEKTCGPCRQAWRDYRK